MNELALFAGAGGGILGGQLLGWHTVCAVEIEEYPRKILLRRQFDGFLPRFPIWDDIRTFDGKPWRDTITVISGGFPCQDISAAGKGAGLTGKSSSLVLEMLRIVKEVRPRFVFAENSPRLRTRGLGTIIKEFTSMGYDVRWCVLGARHVGAPHRRDRMWILATNTHMSGERIRPIDAEVAWTQKIKKVVDRKQISPRPDGQSVRIQQRRGENRQAETEPGEAGWWNNPALARVDDGMANRMDRVKATGNGQVPAVAALAWKILRGFA